MRLLVPILIIAVVLLVIGSKVYGVVNSRDIQCSTIHETTSTPPQNTITSKDYFDLGNYNYDIGKCDEAIADYTRSIEMDLNFPQAYNNRAYTNMRMHNYADALIDLNRAIELKPDYVQALMNRGDIHNYYQVDKKAAIADYDKVIELGKSRDLSNSVCGHKAMAETNNIVPLAILKTVSDADCR